MRYHIRVRRVKGSTFDWFVFRNRVFLFRGNASTKDAAIGQAKEYIRTMGHSSND
jgi:hypothetical protein